MATAPRAFWDDLAEDLRDPDFLRVFLLESLRIETIDRLVNDLDEARISLGMSKAELARAIRVEPATVRRLLSPGHRNPTVGTLVEVAAALGMRVALVPLPAEENRNLTESLRTGASHDVKGLAHRLVSKQTEHPVDCVV